MKHLSLATLTAGLFVGISAQGAITYVDALEGSTGNTFPTGAADPTNTAWLNTTTTGGFDGWVGRTGIDGANGVDQTYLQAVEDNDQSDDIPELTTQITGLADGVYDIWVFFSDQVTNDTQNWYVTAGLTSGSLTSYSAPGEPAIAGATSVGVSNSSGLSFTSSVVTAASSNREMFGANIGQATVVGGSTVNVFIDGEVPGTTGTHRVFYDGVGYELVPEPSSLALLGLGGLLLGQRRKR